MIAKEIVIRSVRVLQCRKRNNEGFHVVYPITVVTGYSPTKDQEYQAQFQARLPREQAIQLALQQFESEGA